MSAIVQKGNDRACSDIELSIHWRLDVGEGRIVGAKRSSGGISKPTRRCQRTTINPMKATLILFMGKLRARLGTVFAFFLAVALIGCAKNPDQLKRELFEAVKQNDVAKVARLIKGGADVKSPETPGGWSPLHFAARSGNEEIVNLLLQAGADPDYSGTAPGQQGTIISTSPKVVAQASLALARNLKSNPLLRLQNAEDQRRMSDPKYVQKCEAVVKLLESKSSN